VVIDSPSSDQSHDGIMLAPDLDATLLVVQADRTRANVVRNLRDGILDAGGRIGGIIFNKRRFYLPDFIYRRV
jgi:Mrp family chromosome partitioning ATPase